MWKNHSPENLEFIEDKRSYDPSKVKDKILIDDHRLMHIGWKRLESGEKYGDWTKEEVWNLHNRIVSEMKKRRFTHNKVDKKLDALRFQELQVNQQIQDILAGLKTFVVSEEFISIAGSSAEGDVDASDVDFVIKLKSQNQLIENKLIETPELKRIAPDVHFIYDTKGSHGKHIVVYDLIAVKRGDLAVGNPQYSFPLFGAAPQSAILPDTHGIETCYLHKENTRCELMDVDGNRLINYPHIENEGAGMPRPDIMILCGNLTSDGKFEVRDIFRWNSTELTACSPEDRQFFLDKLELTPNILRYENQNDALILSEQRIVLMQPFLPLKVRQGYGENEFNDVNDLIRFWANGEYLKLGIAIQEKADGFRIVWHKKGNEVKGFTEDKKRDRADMLPAIRDEIKKLSPNELILDTEVVMHSSDGKFIPRHEAMAIIASKTPVTSWIMAHIHDCLWYDEPKNEAPYVERIALAKKAIPRDTKHLRVMETYIAHNETELRTGIKKAAKTLGSEGAMLKVLNSTYPLNGRTPLWAKLKFVKEITLKVIGIRRKRAAGGEESKGTFLYRGAFLGKNGKLEAMHSQHIIGPSDMNEEQEWDMGGGFKNAVPGEYGYAETYASNIAAKIGELITIAPIHILKFIGKDDKERYATMFPRMRNLETAKTQPDNYEQLDKLAALGEGSSKMSLEEALGKITTADFPITIKEG